MFNFPHCHPGASSVALDSQHRCEAGNSHCCWLLHVATPVCSASPLEHGDGNVLYLYSCGCASCVHCLFPAVPMDLCLQGAPVWRHVQQSWAGHGAEVAAHGGLPWPSQHAGGDVRSCSCCKHPILLFEG